MTLIPKSIASDTIKYQKLQHKFQLIFLFIIFIMAMVAPFPFIVILILFFLHYYHIEKVYQTTAHEIIDINTGLLIKNGNNADEINYSDILAIDYYYSFFIFQNNAVKLTIKPHDKLGDTVYFVSWADSCNYNREFRLNPMVKTPETLAWIEHIKDKSKHNPTSAL